MDVQQHVYELIKNVMGVGELKPEMDLKVDLGMDEDDVVSVLLDLEEALSLDLFTVEEFGQIEKVADFISVTSAKVKVDEPVKPEVEETTEPEVTEPKGGE